MEFIDHVQFSKACAAWAADKRTSLGDFLIQLGWIGADDKQAVELLLERKRRKYGGDIPATLSASADSTLREAMRRSGVPEIRHSVDSLPAAEEGAPSPGRTDGPGPPPFNWLGVYREGALGQVWVGRDDRLNRTVALKVIRADRASHPDARRRFLREAQVTGQLEHPNIVPVYELGQRPEDGQPFYAMRLLGGETLQEVLARHHQARREGRFDPVERRRLLGHFLDVCNAVAYAHARGVLHRDIKPHNVMLGPFGETLVLDWGLAKVLDGPGGAEATESTDLPLRPRVELPAPPISDVVIGTPAYMSPEQAAGAFHRLGTPSDVYNLGATLYHILTGEAPFRGGIDLPDILVRVGAGDFPRPRQVNRDVPRPLEAICLRAMARRPEDRYPSARDLATDLERWLADEPVAAYPESWMHRLVRRWLRF